MVETIRDATLLALSTSSAPSEYAIEDSEGGIYASMFLSSSPTSLGAGSLRAGALYDLARTVSLTSGSASFTGSGYGDTVNVSDLVASTWCEGKTIGLSWTNPPSTFTFSGGSYSAGAALDVLTLTIDGVVKTVDFSTTAYGQAAYINTLNSSLPGVTAYASGSDIVISTQATSGSIDLFGGALAGKLHVLGVGPFTVLTAHIKIVRRAYYWPFDLSDDYDTLYDGTPISSFVDTGPTLTDPTKVLEPQTYYYYLVLVSHVAVPLYYDITDNSRCFALSIDSFGSKDGFFWKNSPKMYKRYDVLTKSEGGGEGDLDKWYSVMGCWLNLMRGYADALRLAGDDDVSPYGILKYKNLSNGTSTEGTSYDWSVARRQATSQNFVYKSRGSCEGIIQAVRMFTLWDAECAEMGLASGCWEGPSSLKIWDGYSTARTHSGLAALYTQTVQTGGNVTMSLTASYALGLWDDGKMVGPIGDVTCIDTSSDGAGTGTTVFTTKVPAQLTTTSIIPTAGITTVALTSTVGVVPGMALQFSGRVGALPVAEITEVVSVSAATSTIVVLTPIQYNYSTNAKVSIAKGMVRYSQRYVNAILVNGSPVITVPGALWPGSRWTNFYFTATNGVNTWNSRIGSSTTNTMSAEVAGSPVACPVPSGVYTLTLTQYSLGGVVLKFLVGAHSELFEPLRDIRVDGSIYSTRSKLWSGASNLAGVWGPNDVGVYITTPGVLTTYGKPAGTISTSTILLDPSSTAPAVNAWVGYWLNPNQNQSQTFEIISNTATSVTVSGNISSLVNTTQYYWIMPLRDRNRFTRIASRLNKEFTHQDITPHVLFV